MFSRTIYPSKLFSGILLILWVVLCPASSLARIDSSTALHVTYRDTLENDRKSPIIGNNILLKNTSADTFFLYLYVPSEGQAWKMLGKDTLEVTIPPFSRKVVPIS